MDLRILEKRPSGCPSHCLFTISKMMMSIHTIVVDALSGQRLTPQQISTINTLLKQRHYSAPDLIDLDRLIDAIISGHLPTTPEILHSVLHCS